MSDVEIWINIGIAFALLVIKIFAFVSALLYSGESYVAADKLNKATWTAILGVGVLLQLVPINLSIVNLAMTVAALVYLADVRPALAGLRRR
ncbi:hypothetical protein ASD81_07950 [Nocardioides sp. Root614]|nr:hypothetical protein ASD81_07950 [Nocardioides sp. Root614]KRA93411.1 hypothetical protein ASD84_08215 [Nocardioides sp. Root682]